MASGRSEATHWLAGTSQPRDSKTQAAGSGQGELLPTYFAGLAAFGLPSSKAVTNRVGHAWREVAQQLESLLGSVLAPGGRLAAR